VGREEKLKSDMTVNIVIRPVPHNDRTAIRTGTTSFETQDVRENAMSNDV